MKVFITNFNAIKIVSDLNTQDYDINDEIFSMEFKWFSSYEVKELLAFKFLYESPEQFFGKYNKNERIDYSEYVFENGPPAFHEDKECRRLLSNFINYKIPPQIKAKGKEVVKEFLEWVKENKDDLSDRKIEKLKHHLRMKYGIKEDLEIVNFKNSGIREQVNLELAELEDDIKQLIVAANGFYKETDKHQTILNYFGKHSFIHKKKDVPYINKTTFSNEEIWEVLEEFETSYKNPIRQGLKEYYRVKFNPELKFEGKLLSQLGFMPCSYCCDNISYDFFDVGENKAKSDEIMRVDTNIPMYVISMNFDENTHSYYLIVKDIVPNFNQDPIKRSKYTGKIWLEMGYDPIHLSKSFPLGSLIPKEHADWGEQIYDESGNKIEGYFEIIVK